MIKTDIGTYLPSPTPSPLPPAGGSFIDGLSGIKLTRLTDEKDGAGFGTTYSIWPTANCDNTRLWILNSTQNSYWTAQFDPSTGMRIGALKPVPTIPGRLFVNYESALWSGSNPDKIFIIADAKICALDVATNSVTVVRDLTSRLGSDYFVTQQHKSRDDKRFAGSGKFGFFVYDMEQDKILLDVRTTDMNGIALDRSGKWLLYVPSDDNTEYIYNVETGTREQITSDPRTGLPDFTIGHCDVGTGVIAGNDRWRGGITLRSFAAPHAQQLAFQYAPAWISQHLSMTSDDERWALLSTYLDVLGTDPNRYKNECFQVGIQGDAIGKIRRLFHHHARTDDPDFNKRYWAVPKANISRDGRFVFFTSNMGGSRNDLWVADLASVGEVPQPEPPLPTPTPPTPVPPTDTTKPTVKVIQPASGDVLSGVVTVQAEVSDDVRVDSAYLIVDGVNVASKTEAPYTFILDTGKLAIGPHSMFVRAWDASGNPGDSLPVQFTVQAVQPTPVPLPTPTPTPTPPPLPPTPCSISAPSSITVRRNSTTAIPVTLSNLSGPTEVTVEGSDGQVTVTPLTWTTGPTATIKQFQVKVKRQGRTITFRSPCGVAVVRVNVS